MEYEAISWSFFRKTGAIDAYLLHTALRKIKPEKEGKSWEKSGQRH